MLGRSVYKKMKLTENKIKRSIALYNSGISYAVIAKKFKVSEELLRRALVNAGVNMRHPKARLQLAGQKFGKSINKHYNSNQNT